MSADTNVTYIITGWDEETLKDFPGGKVTRATVSKTYTGVIEGKATQQYVLTHKADCTAEFIGMELIIGSVEGKKGTFVMREEGTFSEGKATAGCTVIDGSATGALAGLSGHGGYSVSHGEAYKMWFEWELVE